MNVEVLVSTMNQGDLSLVKKMNIQSDALIINQSQQKLDEMLVHKDSFTIRMKTFVEKGLSKSRNKAINLANGDICIIADDDVIYEDNYRETVLNAYNENPDYDIIVFQVPSTNNERQKVYYEKRQKMGYLKSLKVASYEITFKRKSIIDNNISFNEHFGAGSGRYSMGEENIFLYDCLRKGLKVLYLPIKIGTVTHEESTWFSGFNEKYFIDRGANYYAMSRTFCIPLILQHAIRKYSLYKDNLSLKDSLILMFKGRKKYINELKRNI